VDSCQFTYLTKWEKKIHGDDDVMLSFNNVFKNHSRKWPMWWLCAWASTLNGYSEMKMHEHFWSGLHKENKNTWWFPLQGVVYLVIASGCLKHSFKNGSTLSLLYFVFLEDISQACVHKWVYFEPTLLCFPWDVRWVRFPSFVLT